MKPGLLLLHNVLFPAPDIPGKRASIYPLLPGAPALGRHLTAVLPERQSDQVTTWQYWVCTCAQNRLMGARW